MTIKLKNLAVISAMLVGGAATAATATGTLVATAVVVASCTIGAATLAFGVYDPASSNPLDAQTTVPVVCTSGSTYSIYSTTPLATRTMVTGLGGTGKVLTFDVHGSILNRTNNIPLPVTNTAGSIAGTGNGLLQNVDLFGRVAATQSVTAGVYTNAAALTNLTIEY